MVDRSLDGKSDRNRPAVSPQSTPKCRPVAAALRSGKPEWFSPDHPEERAVLEPGFAAAGVRSAIAVPVLWRDEAVAVLEFMTTELVSPQPEILDVVVQIRTQLAQLVERIRAQTSAQEQEEELAHISRVASMGEMASSIAHELNQPLAAVVNYAAGISQMLQREGGDLNEILGPWSRSAIRRPGPAT